MKKTISLNSVEYEMLVVIAKQNHLKPEDYVKRHIKQAYAKIK